MRMIKGDRHSHRLHSTFEQKSVTELKLTSFCISKELDDGILLCHTVTGELFLLAKQEYQAIHSMQEIPSALAAQLTAHAFLVDKDADEYALVDHERQMIWDQQESSIFISSFTILPTSRCNARCFYCYENNIPQKNMSCQTAEDVAAFIAQHCKAEEVKLHWFGGEPTIANRIISLICTRLAQKDIQYNSSIISNGLLLDKKMIATAKTLWNLKNIQITIDGTECIYNSTKNYKGHYENPFQTVLSNIDCLIESSIPVSVRINLGIHNFEDISNLIGQLSQRYAGNPYFRAYVHEITNYYDDSQNAALMKQTYLLNRRLIQMRLREPEHLPSMRLHSCMADSDDSVLINPDGQLGKCEHYAYKKLYGSIYTQECDESVIAKWRERICFAECRTCPFYASCYIVAWCDGGIACNAHKIHKKTLETQDSMGAAYMHWKQRLAKLRKSKFILNTEFEIKWLEGREIAEFPTYKQDEPTKNISVNETAKDILNLLLKISSFQEIVDMLHQIYMVENDLVENDVEDYLMQLLDMGLCKQVDDL